MNDEGVCRTAPATPGLLNTWTSQHYDYPGIGAETVKTKVLHQAEKIWPKDINYTVCSKICKYKSKKNGT